MAKIKPIRLIAIEVRISSEGISKQSNKGDCSWPLHETGELQLSGGAICIKTTVADL